MARIENRSGRQYDICWGGRLLVSVPASRRHDETGAVINGSAEVDDDALAEVTEKDDWAKAVFASGDLIRVSAAEAKPAAASVSTASATTDDTSDHGKGKHRR